MRAKTSTKYTTNYPVSCGKRACIVFYQGDQCAFCESADAILRDALLQYGVSDMAVREVDVGDDDMTATEEGIVGLPTIEICSKRFVGLPQEGAVRDAVLEAIMHECFCDL